MALAADDDAERTAASALAEASEAFVVAIPSLVAELVSDEAAARALAAAPDSEVALADWLVAA
ncbi:MAG TPA: hypothetical protein ENI69_11175 [Rhodospirillales bacterium]|nr:hypothetical protein [Rhodospirillales bacterium]